MKRTKKDKRFMIQFDQNNKDFLTNMSMFLITFLISVTSLLISVLAVIYSLHGISTYSIIVTIVFSMIILVLWFKFIPRIKKGLKNSKNINHQLQKVLFELHPEYKNKLH